MSIRRVALACATTAACFWPAASANAAPLEQATGAIAAPNAPGSWLLMIYAGAKGKRLLSNQPVKVTK